MSIIAECRNRDIESIRTIGILSDRRREAFLRSMKLPALNIALWGSFAVAAKSGYQLMKGDGFVSKISGSLLLAPFYGSVVSRITDAAINAILRLPRGLAALTATGPIETGVIAGVGTIWLILWQIMMTPLLDQCVTIQSAATCVLFYCYLHFIIPVMPRLITHTENLDAALQREHNTSRALFRILSSWRQRWMQYGHELHWATDCITVQRMDPRLCLDVLGNTAQFLLPNPPPPVD